MATEPWFVQPGGDDMAFGDINTPLGTLNGVLARMVSGDLLYVRGGVYNESLLYNIPPGTPEKHTRIEAYEGEEVWIAPTSGDMVVAFGGNTNNGNTGEQSYIDFTRIGFDGNQGIQYNVVVLFSDTDRGYRCHHIRFVECIFQGNEHGNPNQPHPGCTQTLLMPGPSPTDMGYNEVIRCRFRGGQADAVGNDFSNVLYIQTPNNLVEDCIFEHGTGAGVQVYNSNLTPSTPNGNIIRRNIMRHFTKTPGTRGMGIVVGSGNRDCVIENNLVYNMAFTAGGGGIEVLDGWGHKVRNNTLAFNALYGIQVTNLCTDVEVTNNIAFGNGINYENYGTGTVEASNLLDGTDPQFVDAAAENYQLQATSPALHAGTTLPSTTPDLVGVTRPQGQAYSQGAYEGPTTGAPTEPPGCAGGELEEGYEQEGEAGSKPPVG